MALTVTGRWSVHPCFPAGVRRVAIGLGTRSPMGDASAPPNMPIVLSPNSFFTELVESNEKHRLLTGWNLDITFAF